MFIVVIESVGCKLWMINKIKIVRYKFEIVDFNFIKLNIWFLIYKIVFENI